MFSEVTEVRDAIHLLTARAADEQVARDLIREMAWFDAYLARGGVDRSANPNPGNKAGGLTNIVEKALGSTAKAGTSAIAGVFGPGERVTKKGLIFAATPASDFICGTLQLAASMNMHVFTTGRGTPYGLAMAPVIKVASRSALAERWSDLIDFDAGPIATGDATIEQVGTQLFQLILDIASGRKQTSCGSLGPAQRPHTLQPCTRYLVRESNCRRRPVSEIVSDSCSRSNKKGQAYGLSLSSFQELFRRIVFRTIA